MTNTLELPGPIYMLLSDVENLERYRKGGYHPVNIGDELHHGRYRIVHKLGYGAYSTVWLARDQQQDQYAALKIATADAFTDRTEIQVLHRLAGLSEAAWLARTPETPGCAHGHPGREFVAEILDEFEIRGPNGNHQCIVLEPLGASLSTAFDYLEGWRLPPDVSRKVALQLAEGLSYLHACGIVHGDLHEGNVLFRLPNLSQWSAEQVYSCFGRPRRVEIGRLDGRPPTPQAPEYAVYPPLARKLLSACMADASIRIVDFGESFFSTKCIPRDLHTPVCFAAPEVLFRDHVGPPSDVWALACLLYNVFGNSTLFASYDRDRDEVLGEMARILGRFPNRWWDQWAKRADYFAEDVTGHYGDKTTSVVDIQTRLQGIPRDTLVGLEPEEIAAFERILLGMLRFEPDERISAKEVVQLLPGVCGVGGSSM